MTRHTPLSHRLSLFRRGVAFLGVALVLALGVLGVSPQLHEALCHHEPHAARDSHHTHAHAHAASHHGHCDHGAPAPADDDNHGADGCVVTQFSHGHALALAALEYLVALNLPAERPALAADVLALASSTHRFPPGCGPPSVRAVVA